jgi:hypothetical protein
MLSLLRKHPDLRRLAKEAENARKLFDSEYERRLEGD